MRIRRDCKDRMTVCESDQNYVALGRLLIDTWHQINELSGEQTTSGGTTLSEFERKLAERKKKTS